MKGKNDIPVVAQPYDLAFSVSLCLCGIQDRSHRRQLWRDYFRLATEDGGCKTVSAGLEADIIGGSWPWMAASVLDRV